MIANSLPRRLLQFGRFEAHAAASIAGLVGGAAYLAAQTLFAAADPAVSAWAPVQRIGAILLGADAAPPAPPSPGPVMGIALLIHAALCVIYGRFIGLIVRRFDLPRAMLIGAILGLMLFGLNLFVIAPSAFPWFADARTLATALDHVLFGSIAAAGCVLLRRRDRGSIIL